MALGLLGLKVGMTQVYDAAGKIQPVTVLQVGPCRLLQVRDPQRDGYDAVQLGFIDKPRRKATRAERGHVSAALESKRRKARGEAGITLLPKPDCEPQRYIREFRVEGTVADELNRVLKQQKDAQAAREQKKQEEAKKKQEEEKQKAAEARKAQGLPDEPEQEEKKEEPKKEEAKKEEEKPLTIEQLVGQTLTAEGVFANVPAVDVIGTSKGRGTAGAMKRHGFAGLPASHGVKKHHRSPGSVGSHASNRGSGRPKKGKRMAGRYGNSRVTVRNLRVVRIDHENNLLLVRGAVPGPNGGLVMVRPTNKKG